MLSLEPQRTDYDVNFHCGGFPVRVHPLFWLAALILGANGVYDGAGNVSSDAAIVLLSWVSVLFVSILIHELGHALVMRRFGLSSHIVLYLLGGLAVADTGPYSVGRRSRLTPTHNIMISLAGPAAGFLLAVLTVLGIVALGGKVSFDLRSFPYFYYPVLPADTSQSLLILIEHLLYVNILWGLVNLLPVFPLDGGQVARQLFERVDPWNGFVRSLWLSIATSVLIAAAAGFYLKSTFMALMFISLAASNYMMLQQMGGGGFGGRRW